MLLSLPLEIQRNILLLLAWGDVAACAATCRHLHSVISSDLALAYKRELALAGLCDNPSTNHSTKTRLQMLRRREARWHAINIPSRGPLKSIENPIPDSATRWLREAEGRLYLGVRKEPTEIRVIEMFGKNKTYTIPCTGKWLSEVALSAVENDLIACLLRQESGNGDEGDALEIRLIRISTGTFHEAAAEPILEVGLIRLDGHPPRIKQREMKICGDILALAVQFVANHYGEEDDSDIEEEIDEDYTERELYVWNWRTGELKQKLSLRWATFVFLERDLLLTVAEDSLEVIYIPPLRLPKDGPLDPSERPMRVVQRFQLPPAQDHDLTLSFTLDTQPLRPQKPASHHPQLPFYPDPRYNIITATMWFLKGMNTEAMLFVFYTSAIMDRALPLLQYLRSGRALPFVQTFEWDLWGPEQTQLLEYTGNHGSASPRDALLPVRGSRLKMGKYGMVYDFSPRVKEVISRVDPSRRVMPYEEKDKVVDAEPWKERTWTILQNEEGYSPFAVDVVAKLPFVRKPDPYQPGRRDWAATPIKIEDNQAQSIDTQEETEDPDEAAAMLENDYLVYDMDRNLTEENPVPERRIFWFCAGGE